MAEGVDGLLHDATRQPSQSAADLGRAPPSSHVVKRPQVCRQGAPIH